MTKAHLFDDLSTSVKTQFTKDMSSLNKQSFKNQRKVICCSGPSVETKKRAFVYNPAVKFDPDIQDYASDPDQLS